MAPIKCFLVTDTDQSMLHLRRYADSCDGHLHDASTLIGPRPSVRTSRGTWKVEAPDEFGHDDPQWPTHCSCGYAFLPTDTWQHFTRTICKREDTGQLLTWDAMPPGAIRDCEWLHGHTHYCGPDGKAIQVRIPAKPDGSGTHDWLVDTEASNCTRKGDLSHKCWCRHGEPPNLHVDKSGYPTCSAGAGSIVAPEGWHGFLHHGHLVTC